MRSTVAWMVLVVAAGCSGSVHVSQPIGAAGGAVDAPNGTGVSIPPGALPGDLTISVASDSGAATPGGVDTVGVPYLFGPEGTQFSTPVTVTLKVDLGKLPAGKTLADVVVYTAPAGTKQYVALVTSVADATHVSAKTTHFSVLVPGVPTSSPDCRVNCSAGSTANCSVTGGCAPSTTAAQCTSACMGHSYYMSCTDGACDCAKDGTTTGTASLSGTDAFAAYQTGCGFPGDLPCDYTCAAGVDTRTPPATGGSTNPAPASATPSCSCYGSCKGMYYMLACLDGTCTCGVSNTGTGGSTNAGTPTPASFGFSIASFSLSCDTDTSALEASWVSDCNYPGTVAPPSYGDTIGTSINAGVGNADGGTVQSPDAGTSTSFPDMSTSTVDLACQHMFMASAPGCSVQENCSPHNYAMMCDGSLCHCMSDAGAGPTLQQVTACGSAMSADSLFTMGCGYP